MTLSAVIGALDRAKRTLAPTMKSMKPNQAMSITSVDKAITALRPLSKIFSDLEQHRVDLDREHQTALANRREDLLKTARDAQWSVARRGSYDFVGCFRVNYRNDRVTLRIGSEELTHFDETDGKGLFSRLVKEKEDLDTFPFVRSDFFRSIRGSIDLARSQNRHRDGKVPIRQLYPLVVLTRHSLDNVFIKRPLKKFFTEYSMAQFVYDLARFGKVSWKEDGYRLRTRTPNMDSSGQSVTLPLLDRAGSDGHLVGVIWIERVVVE